MPATQHAVISGLWQQGEGCSDASTQHAVISGRRTMISVLPNNRRLWQHGEGCSDASTQHTVISSRGTMRSVLPNNRRHRDASHSTCCDKQQRGVMGKWHSRRGVYIL